MKNFYKELDKIENNILDGNSFEVNFWKQIIRLKRLNL